jgi:hypothetical protein
MYSVVPHESFLYIFTFIPDWGNHIQNTNITPATSYYQTVDILPLTYSALLPADISLLHKK